MTNKLSPEGQAILKEIVDWFVEDPTRYNMDAVQRRKPETPQEKIATLDDLSEACIIGAICASEHHLYPEQSMLENRSRYEIMGVFDVELPPLKYHGIVQFGKAEGLTGFVELANKILKEAQDEPTTVS